MNLSAQAKYISQNLYNEDERELVLEIFNDFVFLMNNFTGFETIIEENYGDVSNSTVEKCYKVYKDTLNNLNARFVHGYSSNEVVVKL